MSTLNVCNICCDTYNKSSRTIITCIYCQFDSCRSCCEKYILSQSTPICMNTNCNKEWSRKFLRENFTNSFLTKKFKPHMENVLFDREKALLPSTQPIVEELYRKEKLKKEIKELDLIIEDLKDKRHALYNLYSKTTSEDKKLFVRQCPADNCRGFLSTQWKCGLCEQWTCPDCHEIKGLNKNCVHTCKPELVETANLLKKDTKPCPKCQSMIFKIDGCDQMWCTQCQTAFNWKTGHIETKRIHNPHYFEWQRKHNRLERNPQDIECGDNLQDANLKIYRVLTMDRLQTIKNKSLGGSINNIIKNYTIIKNVIINTIHNSEYVLPRFQTEIASKNRDLRIKYLKGDITENEFKNSIQKNDKKYRKNIEVAEVIQLMDRIVTDIINRLIDILRDNYKTMIVYNELLLNQTNQILETFIGEIEQAKNYCTELFNDISFTYNSIRYGFDNEFRVVVVNKSKI